MTLRNAPGTYALVLACHQRQTVQIGRWGELATTPGHYVYVGSAFGPGGVGARLSRHFGLEKRLRWHIDYLRAVLTPVGAWISYAPERLEHRWADRLDAVAGFTAIPGFGSSDCRCTAHLFHARTADGLEQTLAAGQIPLVWQPFPGA